MDKWKQIKKKIHDSIPVEDVLSGVDGVEVDNSVEIEVAVELENTVEVEVVVEVGKTVEVEVVVELENTVEVEVAVEVDGALYVWVDIILSEVDGELVDVTDAWAGGVELEIEREDDVAVRPVEVS